MAGNGVPEKGKFNGVAGVAGGSAKGVLLVLLALAVCFGYFYYFTDMLRPKEETPMQYQVYPAEVKKPLPERPSQPVAANLEGSAPPASSLPEQPADPDVSQPSGGNAPEVASNTQARQGEIPVAPAAKPTQKAVTAADKKLPAPAAQQQAPKPATRAAGKPAAAAQKTAAAKTPSKEPARSSADKKTALASAKTETASAGKASVDRKQKTAKAEAGEERSAAGRQGANYTLIVGTYVLKSTLLAAKSKLEHAGFKPVVTPGRKKNEPMNRLILAEFASYSSASSELERVRKSSRDAFILQENGRYVVYAGSYFDQERAAREQDRLRREGFAPIVKKSSAPVQTYTLSSGGFATREQAEKEAARLRKLGFTPLPAPMK